MLAINLVLTRETKQFGCIIDYVPHLEMFTNRKKGHVIGKKKKVKRILALTYKINTEKPMEREMATHPSILSWRIPGMGEPVGCHLGGHTESDTTEAT